MVGLEQSVNELLMKLKADDHIWCASQTNREQCNLKTRTELPRTEPEAVPPPHCSVSGLPVFAPESSSSLRAHSAVMEFNVVPCTPLSLQVSPHPGIACCTGFPTLLCASSAVSSFIPLMNWSMQNTVLSLLPASGVLLPFHPLPLPLQIPPSRALLLPTSSNSFSSSFHLPTREQISESQNSTLCHS